MTIPAENEPSGTPHDQSGQTKSAAQQGAKGSRTAARLFAVQALFQIQNGAEPYPEVIKQFRLFRLRQPLEDQRLVEADEVFFEDVVRGVCERREEVDGHLSATLVEGWRIERLEGVLVAILRAGIYELLARPDVPTAVVINEYLDVADGFECAQEKKLINGILNANVKRLRPSGSD